MILYYYYYFIFPRLILLLNLYYMNASLRDYFACFIICQAKIVLHIILHIIKHIIKPPNFRFNLYL